MNVSVCREVQIIRFQYLWGAGNQHSRAGVCLYIGVCFLQQATKASYTVISAHANAKLQR